MRYIARLCEVRYCEPMKIKTAEFVKGVIGDDYSMGDARPQIAFLGRSNVGKSSVINSLLGRKKLVRSSATPGKTREANYFLVNDKFYFVDFPGYGYAKISHKDRDKLIKRILWYIQYSNIQPVLVVLILDIKVGITEYDKEMIQILKENKHDVILVANKVDKLKQGEVEKYSKKIKQDAGDIDIVLFSAKTGKGRDILLQEVQNKISPNEQL